MEDFFTQLLEDLKEISGIQQLHWLKKECADSADNEGQAVIEFKRKKKVLIQGMMWAAGDYPYIPEEEQKKIIKEQAYKDQSYDHLDSRVIHKWLTMNKDRFWAKRLTEEELTPPPVLSIEEAQPYIKQLNEIIANVGKKVQAIGKEEAETLGAERIKDPRIQELKDKFGTGLEPRPVFIVGDLCPNCLGFGYTLQNNPEEVEDKVPCLDCDLTGKVNRYEVHASNQAEADKCYVAFLEDKQLFLAQFRRK